MSRKFAIIEIGSNNTKTHVYEDNQLLYENNKTIEFKKNYNKEGKIVEFDLEQLYMVIEQALKYTSEVHVYGCSIFRNLSLEELEVINQKLREKYSLEVEVVSQDDEAKYTALGCYQNINYEGNICIFIGGGGSIELIFVQKGKIIGKKYFDFGVVDITNHFPSLKDDIPTVTFKESYQYVDSLIGEIMLSADLLILAGGDHLYWYQNAKYSLDKNINYQSEKARYMLTIEKSDQYDQDALVTSLNKIRNASDNPLWFDGARAMKIVTNVISHKIKAKYIIPTKINMEDGIKDMLYKQK